MTNQTAQRIHLTIALIGLPVRLAKAARRQAYRALTPPTLRRIVHELALSEPRTTHTCDRHPTGSPDCPDCTSWCDACRGSWYLHEHDCAYIAALELDPIINPCST